MPRLAMIAATALALVGAAAVAGAPAVAKNMNRQNCFSAPGPDCRPPPEPPKTAENNKPVAEQPQTGTK